MNVEHMQKTRDLIAHHHDRFTMTRWAADVFGDDSRPIDLISECGSVGCVAGWAVAAAGEMVMGWDTASRAGKLLGLTPSQAIFLFTPLPGNHIWGALADHPSEITGKDAVDVLDRIIAGDIQL